MLQDIYTFFSASCKWNKVYENEIQQVENSLKLRNMSKTRWFYSSESIEAVWRSLSCIPKAVVISRGLRGDGAPLLKLLFIWEGAEPPKKFKASPLSINSSRSLVFKDRDVNCISLARSFIPSILPFYVTITIFLIVDYTIR